MIIDLEQKVADQLQRLETLAKEAMYNTTEPLDERAAALHEVSSFISILISQSNFFVEHK